MSNFIHKGEYSNPEELQKRCEVKGIVLRANEQKLQLSENRNAYVLQSSHSEEHIKDDAVSSSFINTKITYDIMSMLCSPDINKQLAATEKIRELLSEDFPPIDEVIQMGMIPRLVENMKNKFSSDLQFNAAWALTNVTSGTSEQTKVVVESGAIPIFINLLSSEHEKIREQAVWALGNIACDSSENRECLLDSGVFVLLLQHLNKPSHSIVRTVLWALSALCRKLYSQSEFSKVSPCLPVLSTLLYSSDTIVLAGTCKILSYLSDGPQGNIAAVIDAGVCRRLVELLRHNDHRVVIQALGAVGNITTGNDAQTQVILNCLALPELLRLVYNSEESIKKDACWVLSNITAGNKEQIQAVLDENIFHFLIQILRSGSTDLYFKKEAASAIINATGRGTSDQVRYLVNKGCIPPLCDLLIRGNGNMVYLILSGLESILRFGEDEVVHNNINPYAAIMKQCNGLENIELLLDYDYNDINNMADNIIRNYFDSEESTDIAPSVHKKG